MALDPSNESRAGRAVESRVGGDAEVVARTLYIRMEKSSGIDRVVTCFDTHKSKEDKKVLALFQDSSIISDITRGHGAFTHPS